VARLARDAASGADADLAGHADLLAAMEAGLAGVGDQVAIRRLPAVEAAERARQGTGTAFATLSTYFVAGGDPDALRAAHLDFDRVPEWTGKPGSRVLAREGDDVIGEADAVRRVLGRSYGARWRIRARPLARGEARVTVTRLLEGPPGGGMLATRGVLVAFPERGGARVAEVAASVVGFEIPSLLRGVASRSALAEMRARLDGIRAHWTEYRRR
jgi:hypothetical protein